MTEREHLLVCLAEEATEVAQAACKALRFGLDDDRGSGLRTAHRALSEEMADLLAVLRLLEDEHKLSIYFNLRMLDRQELQNNALLRKLEKIEACKKKGLIV